MVGCVVAACLDARLFGFGLVHARRDLAALFMGCSSGPRTLLVIGMVGHAKLTLK